MTNKTLQSLKMTALATAAIVGSFFGGEALAQDSEKPNKKRAEVVEIDEQAQKPKAQAIEDKPKERLNIDFDLSSTLVSKCVYNSGAIVGKGPANQEYLGVNIGKYFTAGLWTNYDIGDKKLHERDIMLTGHGPLASIKKGPMKGDITWNLSVQDWSYPSKLLGKKDDFIVGAKIGYSGPVNAGISLTKIVNDGPTLDRNCLTLDISKSFSLHKGRALDVSLTPSAKTVYLNNYYGSHGFTHITPGLDLSVKHGNYGVNFFVRDQIPLSSGTKPIWYGGVSVDVNSAVEGIKSLMGKRK